MGLTADADLASAELEQAIFVLPFQGNLCEDVPFTEGVALGYVVSALQADLNRSTLSPPFRRTYNRSTKKEIA